MIICHSRKFVFFSNPKTGSESVRALLEPYQEEDVQPFREHLDETRFYPHMRPAEARRAFQLQGLDYGAYFKFTFTRNPWARLVSLYEMIHAGEGMMFRGRRRVSSLASGLAGVSYDPFFCRWVARTRTEGPGAGGPDAERWQRFGTYTFENYVADGESNEGIDYVVRLERMSDELPVALEKAGLGPDLARRVPHKNRRSHKPYTAYYNKVTRELVAARYGNEIERFRYAFGD